MMNKIEANSNWCLSKLWKSFRRSEGSCLICWHRDPKCKSVELGNQLGRSDGLIDVRYKKKIHCNKSTVLKNWGLSMSEPWVRECSFGFGMISYQWLGGNVGVEVHMTRGSWMFPGYFGGGNDSWLWFQLTCLSLISPRSCTHWACRNEMEAWWQINLILTPWKALGRL